MESSSVIGSFLDATPLLRWLWRRVMERHMEVIIKKPYSRAPSNTLPAQISEIPIIYVIVGHNPHIYIWLDLTFINHNPDRRERILGAILHLKKKRWFFWDETIAQAPVRVHGVGIEPSGPLLADLVIEPMSSPVTVTVDAKGAIPIPPRLLPKKMVLCLEFQMVGPIRKMVRIVDRVEHNPKQSNLDREDSQTQ